ncbi:MAG: Fic family protein [Sphingopyxis sp.]|nr:Fic family protein [Sphingopyxis sp.]
MKTHPWITFEIDLRQLQPLTWIALGEAQSKSQHLAGVALKPESAAELLRIFLAKGVHATTAIEGNTLSEQQVRDRIEGKEVVPKSQRYLQTEVDNVLRLSNSIANDVAKNGGVDIAIESICQYNQELLAELELDDHVSPGKFRKMVVGVSDYRAPEAKFLDGLMEQFCNWMNGSNFRPPDPNQKIAFGVIKAIVAHLYLAWIHAFGDGNGRTARAMEVRILMEAGVPMTAAHLLSNHYNQTRTEYYRQLSRASKSGGDIKPFLSYSIDGFVDQLRSQIEIVREYQFNMAWENYVYDKFGKNKSFSDKRQIKLLLALSSYGDWIERVQLRRLNVEIVEEYSSKTGKTLTRDLNRLVIEGLVIKSGNRVKANKSMILAFLPTQHAGD